MNSCLSETNNEVSLRGSARFGPSYWTLQHREGSGVDRRASVEAENLENSTTVVRQPLFCTLKSLFTPLEN